MVSYIFWPHHLLVLPHNKEMTRDAYKEINRMALIADYFKSSKLMQVVTLVENRQSGEIISAHSPLTKWPQDKPCKITVWASSRSLLLTPSLLKWLVHVQNSHFPFYSTERLLTLQSLGCKVRLNVPLGSSRFFSSSSKLGSTELTGWIGNQSPHPLPVWGSGPI